MLETNEISLKPSLFYNDKYYFLICQKNTDVIVGHCGLRLDNNKDNYFLGNIEYEIFETYRGNNYAYQASVLLTMLAREKGAEKILITANPDNIASIKTIEKLNATHVEVRRIPKSSRLYKQGERVVTIYELNLKEEKIHDRY